MKDRVFDEKDGETKGPDKLFEKVPSELNELVRVLSNRGVDAAIYDQNSQYPWVLVDEKNALGLARLLGHINSQELLRPIQVRIIWKLVPEEKKSGCVFIPEASCNGMVWGDHLLIQAASTLLTNLGCV